MMVVKDEHVDGIEVMTMVVMGAIGRVVVLLGWCGGDDGSIQFKILSVKFISHYKLPEIESTEPKRIPT